MVSTVPPTELTPSSPVHVFYGTVTGNAEEIARRIAAEMEDSGIAVAPVLSLGDYARSPVFTSISTPVSTSATDTKQAHIDAKELQSASSSEPPTVVVVVSSTTGDGDPPDAIRPFMRYLRKCAKEPAPLAHVQYALLGLGDTNYENFCNAAKKIDAGLLAGGAKPFVDRGLADDGTGLEQVVEPWIRSFFEALALRVSQGLVRTKTASFLTQDQDCSNECCDGDSRAESTESCHVKPTAAATTTPNSASTASSILSDEPLGRQVSRNDHEGAIAEIVHSTVALELGFNEDDLPKLLPPTILLLPEKSSSRSETTDRVLSVAAIAGQEILASPHYVSGSTICTHAVAAKRLTCDGSIKTVYHLEVDCSENSSFAYVPGHAFGLIVSNSPEDVERLLHLANIEPERHYSLVSAHDTSSPTVIAKGSARTLLTYRVDIRGAPKKSLLRALADHCTNSFDKRKLLHLSSKKGREEYTSEIVRQEAGICDILERIAPSCRPPLSLLLDQLPLLAPRFYSAASAPELDGMTLHFAFSVVPKGVATTMLAQICEMLLSGAPGDSIPPIYLNPRPGDSGSAFRPPTSMSTPYIMIGPGTGVAPFRGFLRQRHVLLGEGKIDPASEVISKTMLFYGCRSISKDFLYNEELTSYQSCGTLAVLDVASSRDGPSKVYVQDRLHERADEVAALLKDGAVVYVCGDGGGMAAGVDAALRKIVTDKVCGGDVTASKSYMQYLSTERRYVRDIWFFGNLGEDF